MTGRELPAGRPVTYHETERAYRGTLSAVRKRFEELTLRDLMVGALAKLQARGEYDPQQHPAADDYQPLTSAERLEVLALGQVLADYYRHPAHVHDAVKAGASWEQVAAALDCSEDQARRDYCTWAEGQHQLWVTYEGRFGLDDAEYAAAMAQAAGGDSNG
jgi:hypothetical protein